MEDLQAIIALLLPEEEKEIDPPVIEEPKKWVRSPRKKGLRKSSLRLGPQQNTKSRSRSVVKKDKNALVLELPTDFEESYESVDELKVSLKNSKKKHRSARGAFRDTGVSRLMYRVKHERFIGTCDVGDYWSVANLIKNDENVFGLTVHIGVQNKLEMMNAIDATNELKGKIKNIYFYGIDEQVPLPTTINFFEIGNSGAMLETVILENITISFDAANKIKKSIFPLNQKSLDMFLLINCKFAEAAYALLDGVIDLYLDKIQTGFSCVQIEVQLNSSTELILLSESQLNISSISKFTPVLLLPEILNQITKFIDKFPAYLGYLQFSKLIIQQQTSLEKWIEQSINNLQINEVLFTNCEDPEQILPELISKYAHQIQIRTE